MRNCRVFLKPSEFCAYIYMANKDSYCEGLRCIECGHRYPKQPAYFCEYCFGPLEIAYDYDKIKSSITQEKISERQPTMWRFRELLPVSEPVYELPVGYTPLVNADRLAHKLGIKEVWIKNDTVNCYSHSFKDRVVGTAIESAKEFGYQTIACSSTGSLAHSVAAYGAVCGMNSFVFVPGDYIGDSDSLLNFYNSSIVAVDGTYDDVNRLCSEIVDQYEWVFVNINFRPFYTEGSKTIGYEIAEQLGWKLPGHVIVPIASGALLVKLHKAFEELKTLGFVEENHIKIHGAQPQGCSPVIDALKNSADSVTPVEKPDTIVTSLAVGDPGDGYYALKTIRDSGGWGENPDDDEVMNGVKLLAECEGILSEPAGGVVVSTAKRLRDLRKISHNDSVVLCITGSGMKTLSTLRSENHSLQRIKQNLDDFEQFLSINGAN